MDGALVGVRVSAYVRVENAVLVATGDDEDALVYVIVGVPGRLAGDELESIHAPLKHSASADPRTNSFRDLSKTIVYRLKQKNFDVSVKIAQVS